MLWLIPFLLVCLFVLFRFVSPYEHGLRLGISGAEAAGERGAAEGYVSTPPTLVSDAFRTAYKGFLDVYVPLMGRWRDALVRAAALSQEGGAKATEPTEADLAGVIAGMTSSIGKPFPPPSPPGGAFPAPSAIQTLDDIDRARLVARVPSGVDAYRNAVEWMNDQLLKAEKELNKALTGGGLPALEGFAGEDKCADLSQCFRENPDLVRQLLAAQEEQAGDRLVRTQNELLARFQQFQQPKLLSAWELNGRLVRKAKETEAKAQSGDWIKDVRIGGGDKEEEGAGIVVPPGGNALEELRRRNPARYKELEQKNASLFSLKQLIEQINGGLRA